MKAFTIYPKDKINMLQLIDTLQKYGKCNCDFDTFCKIYTEWHLKTFPSRPVNTLTANFRDDWFNDFVTYLANRDI